MIECVSIRLPWTEPAEMHICCGWGINEVEEPRLVLDSVFVPVDQLHCELGVARRFERPDAVGKFGGGGSERGAADDVAVINTASSGVKFLPDAGLAAADVVTPGSCLPQLAALGRWDPTAYHSLIATGIADRSKV